MTAVLSEPTTGTSQSAAEWATSVVWTGDVAVCPTTADDSGITDAGHGPPVDGALDTGSGGAGSGTGARWRLGGRYGVRRSCRQARLAKRERGCRCRHGCDEWATPACAGSEGGGGPSARDNAHAMGRACAFLRLARDRFSAGAMAKKGAAPQRRVVTAVRGQPPLQVELPSPLYGRACLPACADGEGPRQRGCPPVAATAAAFDVAPRLSHRVPSAPD